MRLITITFSKIVEYSLETLSYTDWSRALPMDFHPQWKQRSGVVTKAFYHPEYSNRLYLQDEYSLCYIDKTLVSHAPESDWSAINRFNVNGRIKHHIYSLLRRFVIIV